MAAQDVKPKAVYEKKSFPLVAQVLLPESVCREQAFPEGYLLILGKSV